MRLGIIRLKKYYAISKKVDSKQMIYNQNSIKDEPDITAIVVNYNTPDLTNKAVESIINTSPDLTKEIIVVDNGSSDNSTKLIKNEWGDKVFLIENSENYGFARANNQAMGLGKGRYFFLLNSDAEVVGDSIEKMVSFADTNPNIGILGCKIVSDSGEQQISCWPTYDLGFLFCRALNLDRIVSNGIFGCPNIETYGKRNNSGPVEAVSGCAMLVRSNTTAKVGLFDEQFFMYCEDMDWCTRMQKAGFEVYFLADAIVRHYSGGTSTGMSNHKMAIELSRSILKFMRKQYGITHSLLANVFMGLFFLIRLPYWVLMSLVGDRKQQAQRMAKSYFIAFCWHAFWPIFIR